MADRAGMPDWPVVRAEAVREDVLDEDLERPTLPELVSVPEAAEILGVSRQRVHELARGGRGFPAPVYELKTGKLWLRNAIVAFGERWDRKPGRPDRGVLLRERVTSALLKDGFRTPDFIFLPSDGVAVIFEIKVSGARHRAAQVIDALNRAGLGVTAAGDQLAEEIEEYLASGQPARVYELAECASR